MQEVERLSESRPLDSRLGVGADRMELSDLTGGLALALGRTASERASRVERLAQEFAERRYQADPLAVSRAILEEMRAAGHEATGKEPVPLTMKRPDSMDGLETARTAVRQPSLLVAQPNPEALDRCQALLEEARRGL
jgi:hypothetical protein